MRHNNEGMNGHKGFNGMNGDEGMGDKRTGQEGNDEVEE